MTPEKQRAFTEAYAACQERFTRYCAALAYGKMDADDLVQDVLLSTYERFEQIRQKDQLIHYLIRAARNRSVSHWRKARHQTTLQDKHMRKLFDNGITPEVSLDVQLMYQKLDQLPENQRDALILFDICGFSLKEIADIQHTGTNTVKSHLSRGRKKLRFLMREKPVRRSWLGVLGALLSRRNEPVFIDKLFFTQLKPLMMYSLSTVAVIASLVLLPKLDTNITHRNQPIVAKAALGEALFKPLAVEVSRPKLDTPEVKKPLVVTKQKTWLAKPITQTSRNLLGVATIQGISSLKTPLTIFTSGVALPSPSLLLPPVKKVTGHINDGGDCDSLKIKGNIRKFKKELLRQLKKDGLIRSKKKKNRLIFRDAKLIINQKIIPYEVHHKYLELLKKYNIQLCSKRLIQTAAKYIAIGRMEDGKFKGAFQLSGAVDIDELKEDTGDEHR